MNINVKSHLKHINTKLFSQERKKTKQNFVHYAKHSKILTCTFH